MFERPLRLRSPQLAARYINFTEAVGFFANAHNFHIADCTHCFLLLETPFQGLFSNRGADRELPPLRSVASCWVGDQTADNLRYVPYPIRLASSGYKRKAFAYEMLRKSVSLNAG